MYSLSPYTPAIASTVTPTGYALAADDVVAIAATVVVGRLKTPHGIVHEQHGSAARV